MGQEEREAEDKEWCRRGVRWCMEEEGKSRKGRANIHKMTKRGMHNEIRRRRQKTETRAEEDTVHILVCYIYKRKA